MFDKAKSLYEQGLTQAEVAEQLGTTQKVIWSLFKRNGYKSRVAKKRNQTGKNNAYWGGKTGVVGYAANHLRVDRERGKPSYCVMCESPVPCHWANVSGQYENPYDYIRLCISCHSKFDKKANNFKGKI